MPTDRFPGRPGVVVALWCLTALSVVSPHLAAQGTSAPPLFLIDEETRVADVGFRFPSGTSIDPSALRDAIAYEGPGGLRSFQSALDFVPGISPPDLERFDPLVLQQDVARMRQIYHNAGFPNVELDYDVTLDAEDNTVDITFIVDQGRHLTLGSLDARFQAPAAATDTAASGAATPLPPELEPAWASYLSSVRRDALGRRLGAQEASRIQNEAAHWFSTRGYPWVRVSMARTDTTDFAIDASLVVSLGPRARVDGIMIEGQQRLSESVLRREIPLETGEWFDGTDLAIGERELYELEMVQRALGDVVAGQPIDSTVTIRYRVNEARPRLVWGRVGWGSESGIGGEAHWSHRNFFGGARVFTVSATAESGVGALEQVTGQTAGLAVHILQPYVGHRSLSATFGPFIRYRDDFRDRSVLYGVESALIFRRAPLKTVTLQHELSRLSVEDAFRLLPVGQLVGLGPDSAFAPIFVKSVFKLLGAYGELDNRIDPRSGFVVEPNLEITGPSRISDVEFFRLGLKSMVAVPLTTRLGLHMNASVGRMFPFGVSDPPPGEGSPRAIVGLRGVMFTAGGTSTVRGWGRSLVGPKIPDVDVDAAGNITSDGWIPVGGLAQLTASVELSLPFPFLGEPHRSFAFLDAGRVWTPGSRFEPPDPELALEPWAFGTGLGLQYATPFGPVRLAVGYKLNPTRVDLLSAVEVARALADGGDLSSLDPGALHRWHLHLEIGRGL